MIGADRVGQGQALLHSRPWLAGWLSSPRTASTAPWLTRTRTPQPVPQ